MGEEPMSFVMVSAGQASGELLALADVVVHDTRWLVSVADELAGATLRLLPGCALVAVGLVDGGCLLRCRSGRTAVVQPGSGSTGELFRLAEIAYSALTLAALVTPGAARQDPPLADRH
jgi:hypothetical protein